MSRASSPGSIVPKEEPSSKGGRVIGANLGRLTTSMVGRAVSRGTILVEDGTGDLVLLGHLPQCRQVPFLRRSLYGSQGPRRADNVIGEGDPDGGASEVDPHVTH